ncbi:MAG: hypothetical protein A2172_01855 [Candidatus Woykebacteria bacterium RBG_13_40_15]|uniref:Uncharacterized protein n=1 Tax=Candidatus Woykebacteria bacterium RBG_13_40_15 TaxID=1802593 RepID=A0A1G1W507_9BACT|nr:MAG: hypothetical protein A2172_01855 [Candidatus Woykebacteria bacterium RBG_13_40_15]
MDIHKLFWLSLVLLFIPLSLLGGLSTGLLLGIPASPVAVAWFSAQGFIVMLAVVKTRASAHGGEKVSVMAEGERQQSLEIAASLGLDAGSIETLVSLQRMLLNSRIASLRYNGETIRTEGSIGPWSRVLTATTTDCQQTRLLLHEISSEQPIAPAIALLTE